MNLPSTLLEFRGSSPVCTAMIIALTAGWFNSAEAPRKPTTDSETLRPAWFHTSAANSSSTFRCFSSSSAISCNANMCVTKLTKPQTPELDTPYSYGGLVTMCSMKIAKKWGTYGIPYFHPISHMASPGTFRNLDQFQDSIKTSANCSTTKWATYLTKFGLGWFRMVWDGFGSCLNKNWHISSKQLSWQSISPSGLLMYIRKKTWKPAFRDTEGGPLLPSIERFQTFPIQPLKSPNISSQQLQPPAPTISPRFPPKTPLGVPLPRAAPGGPFGSPARPSQYLPRRETPGAPGSLSHPGCRRWSGSGPKVPHPVALGGRLGPIGLWKNRHWSNKKLWPLF